MKIQFADEIRELYGKIRVETPALRAAESERRRYAKEYRESHYARHLQQTRESAARRRAFFKSIGMKMPANAESNKRYYHAHKDDPRYKAAKCASAKKYRLNHPDKHRMSCLKYYYAHKDEILDKMKKKYRRERR